MNILLVDDDYTLARSTAKLLQRLGGHYVYITDDPAEIFRRCQTQAVDLVIMDINLPDAQWQGQAVSGADISRVLKNQAQTARIPIILVTAYALAGERQFLLAASQADEFVAKPITDYNSFLNLIRYLANSE
ncbi:response regulator [Scytonema millei VB511283]|uniref:Response regulator n=1 Tax=Scytonema millei VB511283 TaxID=1245923 RepID=A0A9X5E6U1_9CYAN|nr:response regulator [Scytonema millei VB511283]